MSKLNNKDLVASGVVVSPNLANPLDYFHPHAKIVDSLIFVSGLVASRDENGEILGTTKSETGEIKHDVIKQFESIMDSLRVILGDSDSQLSQVVDITVFLTNIERDFKEFNKSYGLYFSEILPTRTTVEVSRFPSNVCIELKVIARKN